MSEQYSSFPVGNETNQQKTQFQNYSIQNPFASIEMASNFNTSDINLQKSGGYGTFAGPGESDTFENPLLMKQQSLSMNMNMVNAASANYNTDLGNSVTSLQNQNKMFQYQQNQQNQHSMMMNGNQNFGLNSFNSAQSSPSIVGNGPQPLIGHKMMPNMFIPGFLSFTQVWILRLKRQ
jgi:hypothetical protein